MPVYEYACKSCGVIESTQRMGQAPDSLACPRCGGGAQRIVSAPYLSRMSRPVHSVFSQAERSRYEPGIARRAAEGSLGASKSWVTPQLERLVGREAAGRLRTVPHPAAPAGHPAHHGYHDHGHDHG